MNADNNWILPEVKEEIAEINKLKLLNKSGIEDDKDFVEYFTPNYVLIDAALWGNDIDIIFNNPPYRSLFRGFTGEELWSVAPYLIDISSNEKLIKKIKDKEPVSRRVTWLYSSEKIDDLRKHLRRFLRMKKEDGSYIYFRFYDPYVLNVVFPNLLTEQLLGFFNLIKYVIADDHRINERRIYYITAQNELMIKTERICGL